MLGAFISHLYSQLGTKSVQISCKFRSRRLLINSFNTQEFRQTFLLGNLTRKITLAHSRGQGEFALFLSYLSPFADVWVGETNATEMG